MRQLLFALPLLNSGSGYQSASMVCFNRAAVPPKKINSPFLFDVQTLQVENKYIKVGASTTKSFMAAAQKDGTPDPDQLEALYKEMAEVRKIMTMVGYRVTSLIFFSLSLFLIIWSGAKSMTSLPLTLYVVSGPLLAAGVSYILEGAAVNDRFTSNTYKRLNIFLGLYGFLWLVASFCARTTRSKVLLNPVVLVGSFVMVVNSFKAWTYGVKGWRKSPSISRSKEIISGTRDSFKILFQIKNLSGTIYLGATGLVGYLQLDKLFELYKVAMDSSTSGPLFAKSLFRFSMFSLLTAVMFTLKEGSGKLMASFGFSLWLIGGC